MRFAILDGFRGFFLLFMMIAHANAYLSAPLGKWNHHYFGWVEDAQGFVFISGLVVALVYARSLLRKGEAAMREGIGARVRKIYTYHAALILFFLACALLLPLIGIQADILRQQAEEPFVFTLASLFLITGTLHMGILPMYIFFMIATPAVLVMFHTGRAPVVLAGAIALWLLAQTGWPDLMQLPVEAMAAEAGHAFNIGIYFNIFGWQALFVTGLWIGWLVTNRQLDLDRLKTPAMAQVFWIALAAFLMLGVFDVMAYTGWGEDGWRRMVYASIDRGNLHPVYVVAFAVNLYLVAWLVIAGPSSEWRVLALVGTFTGWLFTRNALVRLGQHSLQIFVAHIVLVYALSLWAQDREPLEPMAANLLLLTSILPLYAVAWLHDRVKERRALAAEARA